MCIRINLSVGALLLIAVVFLASCAGEKKENEFKKDNPVTVQVGTPTLQSDEKITVSGQIESREVVAISTRMMGFVSSIRVKPGDEVKKGQLLVTISNGDILAKRAQAQAMTSEAEAALKDAQKDFERFEQLYKQQSASAKEFENATLRYNSVKARVDLAREMKNEADATLAYTNLVAPFSGVVTQKYIDEGSLANPGIPILVIEQSNDFQVKASVSENEVGQLREGMDAVVTVKSIGKGFTGKISEISSSSQFSGGQFQIKVVVPASESAGLFSGMHVNVTIPVKKYSQVQSPFVPAAAIIHKDQLSGLYTIGEDQTAQLRWVKTGKMDGDVIEILSGLSPGEKFITQSDGRLYSGVSVLVK